MAHTFTSKRRFPLIKGGFRHGIVDITFVDNYQAGGFSITAADLGLNRIYFFAPPAFVQGAEEECVTEVVYTGETLGVEGPEAIAFKGIKLKMRTIALGAENTNLDDFAGVTIRCRYWGQ